MEDETNPEDSLDQFRNDWKKEIEESQQKGESSEESSQAKLAKSLFLQAVKFERSKKYFDAIRLYKRAIQLEPDIEYRIYQEGQELQQEEDIKNNNKVKSEKSKDQEDDDANITNLIEAFQEELSLENKLLCESTYQQGTIRTEKHISILPVEVFILILKYVVSNELDLKSLERFGTVCKGFYLLSREMEIWKLACLKVWKNNLSPPSPPLTWRDTYINRCRILFDGCYICKINYQRLGENSFQDQFYRPVQIVEYFRLIRFFPSGQIFMMTSADELQLSINRLKNVRYALQSRDVLKGTYHYQDDHVLIVIKKNQTSNYSIGQKYKKRETETDIESTLNFFLEFEINNTTRKNFAKLNWKNYSVSQFKNGQELSSDYDLRSAAKYPPFFFSHVKSFHIESNECLQ